MNAPDTMTVPQLVASLGGPTRLAHRLARAGRKIGASAVCEWGRAGRIPGWWLPELARLVAEDGLAVSADALMSLAVPRRVRARAA